MYSNTKFVFKKGNLLIDPVLFKCGVKQVDGRSPLLFNIFTNDIPTLFKDEICAPLKLLDVDISCLLYADDLVLLSESESGLQSCLDKLNLYSKKWKLDINANKTKIMIFSKGKRKSNKIFHIDGLKLDITERYKYLGYEISFNGNLIQTAEALYEKSLKALFSLKLFKMFQ